MERLVRNFLVILIRYIYRDRKDFAEEFIQTMSTMPDETNEISDESKRALSDSTASDRIFLGVVTAFYRQASIIGIVIVFFILYIAVHFIQ